MGNITAVDQPTAKKSEFAGPDDDEDHAHSPAFLDLSMCIRKPVTTFETPAEPLGGAEKGGTAAFFDMVELPSRRSGYWIGKDIARAEQEVVFYEKLVKSSEEYTVYSKLAEFMVEYGGVCEMACVGKEGVHSEKQLLLLRNFAYGRVKMRLFDIKIGETTAVSGWQGKSGFRAWRGQQLDRITNSSRQGMRLEGVVNAPSTLSSRVEMHARLSGKLGKRHYLQQLQAHEFLHYWMDFRETAGSQSEELTEVVLHATVSRLANLCHALRSLTVPQQWIGSSVALVVDSGVLASEPHLLKSPSSTDACIFDWGRSELGTPESYFQQLDCQDRMMRIRYWQQYCRSMSRILYEAARLYTHRFLSPRWTAVVVGVWDLGAHSEMLLGFVVLRLSDFADGIASESAGSDGKSFKINLQRDITKIMSPDLGNASLGTLHGTVARLPFASECDGTSGEHWRVRISSVQGLPLTRHVLGDGRTVATLVAFADQRDVEPYIHTLCGGGASPPRSFATWATTAALPCKSGALSWEEDFDFLAWPSRGTAASDGSRPNDCIGRSLELLRLVGAPVQQRAGISVEEEMLWRFPVCPKCAPQSLAGDLEINQSVCVQRMLMLQFPWIADGKIPAKFLQATHARHAMACLSKTAPVG